MLTAKMIGMTPAWLTRRGRNGLPPWYIRRPRTREAYWTGIRRWPSLMKTIAATATIATTTKQHACDRVRALEEADDRRSGSGDTMPAKMMKLMPLPIPFSVISSPSHIRRIEPAVRVTIWVSVVERGEVEVRGQDALAS